MKSELQKLLGEAKHSADIVSQVQQLYTMAEKTSDYKELVDIGAVLHKAADAFSEVKKVLEKFSQIVSTKAAQCAMQAGDMGPIHTELVTASIKPKSWYRIPSSRRADPVKWDAIMAANGIPKEVAENELVRWHGPALAEYCGNNGKAIPGLDPGDLSTTILYLSYRWKEKES